jgi:hypothetical protein
MMGKAFSVGVRFPPTYRWPLVGGCGFVKLPLFSIFHLRQDQSRRRLKTENPSFGRAFFPAETLILSNFRQKENPP